LNCDSFFYYPNRHVYGSPNDINLTYEQVTFPTRDGLQLSGWFFPASAGPAEAEVPGASLADVGQASNLADVEQASSLAGVGQASSLSELNGCRSAAKARGTILHLHGNAGNITGHFQHVAWLPAAGWNVLCFDYRGYGKSQGKMTRAGSIIDAHAALDYLLTRSDVDGGGIAAFGQSLGAAIGVVLAAERQEIAGLITDGGFTSYRRVASFRIRGNPLLMCTAWWVPPVLMTNEYDPIEYIGRVAPRPVLIIHGTADSIVPVDMARKLHAAAGEPKDLWIVDGADHYDPLRENPEQGRTKVLAFLEKCTGR
jgi:fermentation-respiration switch protein FrsA (DUF1100 family)